MEIYNPKRRHLDKIRVIQICMAFSMLFNMDAISANEITPFKLTGFQGYLEAPYSSDEQSLWSGRLQTSEKTRTLTEGKVYFFTKSYVYHPKLLHIDLGLGTSYVQEELDFNTGSTSQSDSPYSIDARLLLLGGKPYPITLFYNRKSQVYGSSLEQFESTYSSKGFNISLHKSLTPVEMHIEGSRSKSEGTGFDYRYDDTVDLYSFRSNIPNGKLGNHQLTYHNKSVVSTTGALNAPVKESTLKSESTRFSSRLTFGERREIQLNNRISYFSQDAVRSLNDFRFSPGLQWQHSQELRSYYRLNYLDSEQNLIDTNNRKFSAGFQQSSPAGSGYGAEIHRTTNRTTGSDFSSYGLSGHVNKSYQLSFGQLTLSAGAGYDISDQAVSTNPQVIGESVNLLGITPTQLSKEHILPSSIRVFEVFPGGTEQERSVGTGTTCTAGSDILLVSIGTHIELVNCNGVAGISVTTKVDYEYDAGGTVGYASSSYNYQANLNLFRYYRVYVRYLDKNHSLRSGFTTLPREEVAFSQAGVQVDYPLNGGINVGSEIIYEHQDGTFTSFNRRVFKLYAQAAVFRGSLMLSRDQIKQNYIGLQQDSDLVRNRLHFNARPWHSTSLSLEISDERDTGGIVSRRSKYQKLSVEWRLRRLNLKAEARRAKDEYGISGRDHSQILVTLRRDF